MAVLSSENFYAGRIKDYTCNWRQVTADINILDTVQHCHIDFVSESHWKSVENKKVIKFNENERMIIDDEILKFLSKGIIEETIREQGDVVSNIFL